MAHYGVGLTSHLIKQDVTGDNGDNTLLWLGSAHTDYLSFTTVGDGWIFYWLDTGSDYEYGYGLLNTSSGIIQRYSHCVIFSSTASIITLTGSDSAVISCPANPLGFGLQGAGVSNLSQSIPDATETQLTWDQTKADWETVTGMRSTDKFVLPAWAAAVEVSCYLVFAGLSGATYLYVGVAVGNGASADNGRYMIRVPYNSNDYFVFNTGPIIRDLSADTYQDVTVSVEHDGGGSVTMTGRVDVRILP